MPSAILEARNLCAGYGKLIVLRDVSTRFEKGGVTAVLGPNGAGKSTLLKALVRLIKPLEGSIVFEDENTAGFTTRQLLSKGMAYVSQSRGVFPYMTVDENLDMGGYILQESSMLRKRKEEAFSMFPELKTESRKLARLLSGGTQRMLEVARAMMLSPKLLLLDEPTMGLAPKVSKFLFQKILELRDQGLTIGLVEQNVRGALDTADYVYFLQLGKNHDEGPPNKFASRSTLSGIYFGR